MISVLTPSRGRPQLLQRSVHSLWDTATSPENVEVVIGWDGDDPQTDEMIDQLANENRGPVRSVQFVERLGYGRIYEMYNLLAADATGDWLVLSNDDAIMTSSSWDAAIEDVPPGVLVVELQSAYSPDLCCFPVMHRSMYEALGYYSGPTPHVDSYVVDLARALGKAHSVDVWVEHDRPDLSGRMPDATFLDGRKQLDNAGYFDHDGPVQTQLRSDIERLRVCSPTNN